jgi:hypothetical protein
MRWLDTGTFRGRWAAVSTLLQSRKLDPSHPRANQPTDADAILARALAFWNHPELSPQTKAVLRSVAVAALASAGQPWQQQQYPVGLENALRQLIAVCPDQQTS